MVRLMIRKQEGADIQLLVTQFSLPLLEGSNDRNLHLRSLDVGFPSTDSQGKEVLTSVQCNMASKFMRLVRLSLLRLEPQRQSVRSGDRRSRLMAAAAASADGMVAESGGSLGRRGSPSTGAAGVAAATEAREAAEPWSPAMGSGCSRSCCSQPVTGSESMWRELRSRRQAIGAALPHAAVEAEVLDRPSATEGEDERRRGRR